MTDEAKQRPAPDIEIYLKRAPLDDIKRWLENHFEIGTVEARGMGQVFNMNFHGQSLQCLVVEKVAKGGYASVWFKQNQTPWQTDLECAEDAHAFLQVETRCSVNGWDADQADTGAWYRLNKGEKTTVNWLA